MIIQVTVTEYDDTEDRLTEVTDAYDAKTYRIRGDFLEVLRTDGTSVFIPSHNIEAFEAPTL
ncbi:hypothetical protein AHIS1_p072 [Acaryochloris phage A-HIS1]|nr:hypothetical protein AHIS1_p072 [Acaryochloris phage A-HIS1]